MNMMVSQITGVSNVCSSVCSGADQRKHQKTVFYEVDQWNPSQRASNEENVSI